jgi:hypothetical protein
LPTEGPLFVVFLLGVIAPITLLEYLPGLALGPIAEHSCLSAGDVLIREAAAQEPQAHFEQAGWMAVSGRSSGKLRSKIIDPKSNPRNDRRGQFV